MKNKILTSITYIAFLIMLVSQASSAAVINTQDWTEVQSAMQYADETSENIYFTRTSDGSAVLQDLPSQANVTILQSSQNAYLPNLDAQIRTRNYNYQETVDFTSQTDLVPDDVENFVVITRERPSDIVTAAPLANAIDGWVLVINEENQQAIETELQDANQVIKLGQFRRSLEETVNPYTTETITGENRFELSTNVANRISQETDVTSVKISAGRYLEASIFEDETPVLLTGTNFLAEETENYLIENGNINGVVMIGAELGTVGEEIDEVSEQNNREDIGIFVKYGQATIGKTNEVQALSLFSLPTPSMNLRITAAQYLTNQDKLLTTIQNPSNVNGYALSSIVVKNGQGETITTVGDDEPRYILGDSTEIFSYDVNMTEETAANAIAEFTTNYGINQDNLDTFVPSAREGVYTPPRVLPITPITLQDNSNINVTDVVYDPETARFNVTIQNIGTQSFATLNLQNVTVDGLNTALSSDTFQLDINETETVTIPANLSQQDISETDRVEVNVRYGEQQDLLINRKTQLASLELPVGQGNTSPIVLILLLLIVLTILYILYELSG